MANDPYPAAFKRKAVAEYAQRSDLSLQRVADKHGIHYRTLWRWLEKAGVRPRSRRPDVYDNDEIWKDLKSGMKRKDIASKHGCSLRWVYAVASGRHG